MIDLANPRTIKLILALMAVAALIYGCAKYSDYKNRENEKEQNLPENVAKRLPGKASMVSYAWIEAEDQCYILYSTAKIEQCTNVSNSDGDSRATIVRLMLTSYARSAQQFYTDCQKIYAFDQCSAMLEKEHGIARRTRQVDQSDNSTPPSEAE